MEEKPQKSLKQRLSSANDVINALGGTNAVAELLDIGPSSVSNYRKLGFPARSHFILAKICAERGLDVADAVFGGYQVKTQPVPYQPAAAPANAALSRLADAGFAPLSLPILQPAAPFIDRMGPEMQRRLYTFTDPGGEQLCLRPDLTIPTALAHIASGKSGAARYCYQGTAFRYQPRGSGQPEEFTQLGVEIIGGTDAHQDEIDVFQSIMGVIKDAGLKLEKCEITISDARHFIKRVDRYKFSNGFALALKQRLLRSDSFSDIAALQDKLVANAPASNIVPPNDSLVIAGRSGAEIRERLERSRQNATIAQDDLKELEKFLEESAKEISETDTLNALPSDEELNLFSVSQNFVFDVDKIFKRPTPARKMAYYTGIFFEIRAAGIERPIATGGRYDDLLQSLGAKEPLSAVGGAIALERLTRAVEMQS